LLQRPTNQLLWTCASLVLSNLCPRRSGPGREKGWRRGYTLPDSGRTQAGSE
jgi:hypothetical protein